MGYGMGYGMGSGMHGSGSGMGGSGYGMGGSGYGMGGSGYGGYGMGGSGFSGECCPTKKIWGSVHPEKDGMYDLVIDGYTMMNMMGSGIGGMGSGMGMGYAGMGMGMDMDNMQWPERCSRLCIYKKRNSNSNNMYCFAQSEYSQS